MEDKHVNHLEKIPQEDWGKTPASVKKLVEEMAQQIEQQEKKLTPKGQRIYWVRTLGEF